MYKTTTHLHLPQIDLDIAEFWEKSRIFERSVSERDAAHSFVFFEGPPSANGMPGIHHVMGRAIKDIFCRFQTLNGKQVQRKGGWDTHGLPIELAVEKELGITKEDIGKKISVDEYNAKCRETVMRYKDVWDEVTRKMGYWVDLENPYITYENNYIESVWWLLHRLYDKGLLYKGYTIQPYSPAAGTGLSSHEINQPGCYQDVTDTTIVAMFKLERTAAAASLFDDAAEDLRILAWTTTPWTLPSNTALTVGANIEYVKIKTQNPYTHAPVSVILAKDLVGKWFGGKNQPTILAQSDSFLGKTLQNLPYAQLMPFGNPIEPLDSTTNAVDAFKVILGDFVTTSDGTGVVHTAPSFGADDRRAAKDAGIGALTLVDKQGKFIDTVGEFSGRYVKDYRNEPNYVSVDVDISVRLKLDGYAFNVQKYVHSYPHCWRTDKPILYYPLDSWFVRASSMKERMFELNQTINWKPAATGEGRFGKWLENLQDWNLSRSRYWGIPLPIWRSSRAEVCIQSIEDLANRIAQANKILGLTQIVPKDLHRPYIDNIVLADEFGEPMTRETDLIDVWFDSGAMPYAQHHYPFENQEKFENGAWVADFIAEGVDQTRGWFYTLHAIAVMCFDSIAYKNVISNGLVLDKDGRKMSKRLGNGIDPLPTMAQYGADVVRWYIISNSQPWDNLKFDIDGLTETRNKFFGTLYNTYNFFAIYANIDQFAVDSQHTTPLAERIALDRWVLSKLNSLVAEVTAHYTNYEPTLAARALEVFIDEHLSNWHVRLSRRRFWKGEMNADKKAAYETLHECLVVVAQLMSPIAPFFADWLYRNLTENDPAAHDSVHLSHLPVSNAAVIDMALEQRMAYAQTIASLVLSLRKQHKIRVRQPLSRILLPILDADFHAQIEAVKDLILQEVNVKTIEYITDTSGVVTKRVKPNFKVLGKKLGKNMKAAGDAFAALTQNDIAHLEQTGSFTLTLDADTYDIQRAEVDIVSEDIPGWYVASEGSVTVALDVTLTDHLVAEGNAREFVNRIQNLRKQRDYQVTDNITITVQAHPALEAAITDFGDYIRAETLATVLRTDAHLASGELIDLNEDTQVWVELTTV